MSTGKWWSKLQKICQIANFDIDFQKKKHFRSKFELQFF
jgi:hypothetical protein